MLVDALILIALLKIINQDDLDFWTAVGLALGTSIGVSLLAFGFAMLLGIYGVILAVIIGAALLGVVISAVMGVEDKRAFLIAGIFLVVRVAWTLGWSALLSG